MRKGYILNKSNRKYQNHLFIVLYLFTGFIDETRLQKNTFCSGLDHLVPKCSEWLKTREGKFEKLRIFTV